MSAAPWLAPYAARLAALAPLAPAARLARLDAWAAEAGVVTESGRRLRFVADSDDATAQAVSAARQRCAYETRIFETGEVATRIDPAGARHDLCNALVWLTWPRSKARLNALHAGAIARLGPAAPRGRLRDAATLFDENAVLWVGTDPSLEAALRAFDWPGLFIERRTAFGPGLRVHVFGHALLDKLDAPYPAITAHAWPLRRPADAAVSVLDRALADSLEPDRLSTRSFCPLPVMGLPGWCEANQDPAFYHEATVFRPGRRRMPAAPATLAAPTVSRSGDPAWTCSSPAAPVSSVSN